MPRLFLILTSLFILVFLVGLSLAGIPKLINYQGMLTDDSGNPLTDTLNITFKIYNASSGGTLRWQETQPNIPVINGLFNVILGSVNPIDSLTFNEDYWLDITVGAEQMPTRLRFTSVGYAFRSLIADTAYQVTSPGPISVDGVSNPGGDIDLVAGSNVTITPNDGANTITFSAAGGVSYAGVWTVAKSGGNFTTISTALAACVNPGYNSRYLIRVMPGNYAESFTCSSFVRLQGAGKYVCRIEGTVTGVDSCTIDGFQITQGIVCTGTSPTITHNIITSSGTGIMITPNGIPWIKENEIVGCNGYGIHCNGFGADAWIIANKIERNTSGGILCTNSSPTISNNQILENEDYGIHLIGAMGFPTEPTIDDNVIGRTQPPGSGIGIYMIGYAEPRIITNDIWINYTGIEILATTQPSILGNNINYNDGYGIRCLSSGATKPVVIKGNHVHSNTVAGVYIGNFRPLITHNNVINNPGTDIQYTGPTFFPTISYNIYDNRIGVGAVGQYNSTSLGLLIGP